MEPTARAQLADDLQPVGSLDVLALTHDEQVHFHGNQKMSTFIEFTNCCAQIAVRSRMSQGVPIARQVETSITDRRELFASSILVVCPGPPGATIRALYACRCFHAVLL